MRVVAFFITLGILAQAIIPAGFMPNFSKGKIFELTICQDAGLATILVDGNMNPVTDDAGHDPDNSQCIYTTVPQAFAIATDYVVAVHETILYERYVPRDMGIILDSHHPHFYSAQGPPYILG